MTLKFFAMFFYQVVGLSPMAVSLVGALSPLGVSAAALACQPLSKPVGRVQIRQVYGGLGGAAAGLVLQFWLRQAVLLCRRCSWCYACHHATRPYCACARASCHAWPACCILPLPSAPCLIPPPATQPDHPLSRHYSAGAAGLPAHLPALCAAPAGGGAPGPHGCGKRNPAPHALRQARGCEWVARAAAVAEMHAVTCCAAVLPSACTDRLA